MMKNMSIDMQQGIGRGQGIDFRERRNCFGRLERGCDTCVSEYVCNPCAWVIMLGVVSMLTVIPFIYLTSFNCDIIFITSWNRCTQAFTPIVVIASVWISFGMVMGISYCCRHCRGWVTSVNGRSGYNEVLNSDEDQSLIQ